MCMFEHSFPNFIFLTISHLLRVLSCFLFFFHLLPFHLPLLSILQIRGSINMMIDTMIGGRIAPEYGDTACWATTMCFTKLKIWSTFLQSHNPQRVCSIPLCKWVCKTYFWESMKAGQTFIKSVHMLCPPLDWLQSLHLQLTEWSMTLWIYNNQQILDKASHAVVGTKNVLILRLFSCRSWSHQVLHLESFTHKQPITGNILRPQNIPKPASPFSPGVSALFHELTFTTFALKLETQSVIP